MIPLKRQEKEIIRLCLDACDACITAGKKLESISTLGTPSQQESMLIRTCFKETVKTLESAKACVTLFSTHSTQDKTEAARIICDEYKDVYYALVKACDTLINTIREEGDYHAAIDTCIKACDTAAELSEQLIEENEAGD